MSNSEGKNLHATQNDFWNALTAPESNSSLDSSFLSSTTPDTRLEIYRYAYRARIGESLKEDFSHILKVMGDERFQLCLDGFFEAGGSTQFSLVDTAWDFYNFLIGLDKSATSSFVLNEKEKFFLKLDFNSIVLFYTDTKVPSPLQGTPEELMAKKWQLSDRCMLMEFLPEAQFFVLFKNAQGFVEDKLVSAIEFQFLKHFSTSPLTLEECAELILNHTEWKSSMTDWIGQVSGWFASWSQDQILMVAE